MLTEKRHQPSYISLARALGIEGWLSGNEYAAPCPFHLDSNPSFYLNKDTGLWICHRGDGSGNFINLVERVLNCSWQEAQDFIAKEGQRTSVEQMVNHLGGQLFPAEAQSVQNHNAWIEYYQGLPERIMGDWFLERGFDWRTIDHWGIRYDQIADSVVIPVYWQGELAGVVARKGKGLPKYQNSPGLPSSKILFGGISKGANTIILVEGILDAVWGWQCGLNTASLLGIHLSLEQVSILRGLRYSEIILALDNDEVGREGTKEAIDKLTKHGYLLPQVTMVEFPEGYKDANDCTKGMLNTLVKQRKGCFGI